MKEYLKNSDYRSVLITVLFVIFGSSFAFSAVPLDEWTTNNEERLTHINEKGEQETTIPENRTTWIFEDGTFIPMAKLQGEEAYSIITDHLGTPTEAYDEDGRKVWSRELNIYGETRKEFGVTNFIPFKYQGQYEDLETGLCYNRFRYYDSSAGIYISQDPIGLDGGMNIYSYVKDSNLWVDIFGLNKACVKAGDDVTHDIVLTLKKSDYPETGKHIQDAIKAGHPDILTIMRGTAKANRKQSLKGIPTKKGLDRDEYPMAMFTEGGAGASVRYIDPSDNRGAGSAVGNVLSSFDDGTRVKVVIVD